MTEPNLAYRRLPGRSRKYFGLFSFAQELWMGEDHLLLLKDHFFGETCKRFYLNDIQALEVCKTTSGRRLIFWLSMILLVSMAGVSALFYLNQPGIGLFVSMLSAIPLISLVFHLAFGPTCVFRVHTAVQEIDIECLRRLRTARKVVRTLTPLIEAAQGTVTETMLTEASSAIPAEASSLFRPQEALHNDNCKMHFYSFVSFLVISVTAFADLFIHYTIKDLFDGLLLVALIIFVAQSFARQHTRYVPRALRRSLFYGTIVTVLHILLSGAYGVVVGVGLAVGSAGKPPDFTNIFSDPSIRTDPVFMGIQGGAGLLLLLVGLYGLMAYGRWREELAKGKTSTEAVPPEQPQLQD